MSNIFAHITKHTSLDSEVERRIMRLEQQAETWGGEWCAEQESEILAEASLRREQLNIAQQIISADNADYLPKG